MGAFSCFGFVGPVGLAYLGKLVSDTLRRTRPVANPAHDGIPAELQASVGPSLDEGTLAGRALGIAPSQRVATAETVLRAMSMHDHFARIVLLAGHGSTTVNNPHAAGLDCGACGGHTGEANARIAAAVLNDPMVRRELGAKAHPLPADPVFVAGLHDTTTDDAQLFDLGAVPASHAADVAALRQALDDASRRCATAAATGRRCVRSGGSRGARPSSPRRGAARPASTSAGGLSSTPTTGRATKASAFSS